MQKKRRTVTVKFVALNTQYNYEIPQAARQPAEWKNINQLGYYGTMNISKTAPMIYIQAKRLGGKTVQSGSERSTKQVAI